MNLEPYCHTDTHMTDLLHKTETTRHANEWDLPSLQPKRWQCAHLGLQPLACHHQWSGLSHMAQRKQLPHSAQLCMISRTRISARVSRPAGRLGAKFEVMFLALALGHEFLEGTRGRNNFPEEQHVQVPVYVFPTQVLRHQIRWIPLATDTLDHDLSPSHNALQPKELDVHVPEFPEARPATDSSASRTISLNEDSQLGPEVFAHRLQAYSLRRTLHCRVVLGLARASGNIRLSGTPDADTPRATIAPPLVDVGVLGHPAQSLST